MLYCADAIENMKFEFVCDQQSCEKAQINLYVKVTVSDSTQAGTGFMFWLVDNFPFFKTFTISLVKHLLYCARPAFSS